MVPENEVHSEGRLESTHHLHDPRVVGIGTQVVDIVPTTEDQVWSLCHDQLHGTLHIGVNLEAAGVKTDEKGAVVVDETLKTTADNIWAMGDVKGGLQFTYISLDDFRIIRDNLYNGGNRTVNDRNVIPYSVFINPPLSRVGMTESEAIAKGYEVKTGRLEAMAIPKAKIEGVTDGLLKAVIDAKTDKILGCTLLCNTSHEMINIVAAAMKAEQKYTFLKDMIFTHPTMNEALNDLFGSVK